MKRILHVYIYSTAIISLLVLVVFFLFPYILKTNLIEIVFKPTYKDYMNYEDTSIVLICLNAPLLLIASLIVLLVPRFKNTKVSLLGFLIVLMVIFMILFFRYYNLETFFKVYKEYKNV